MKSKLKWIKKTLKSDSITLLNSYDMQLVYLISFVSTIGSLSVSMVFGWETFLLSNLQRSFMYPIVLISGTAIFLSNRKLFLFSFPLAILGLFTSFLHFFTIINRTLIGCGFALPCATEARIVLFNYTVMPSNLPLMAFLSFFSIIAIIILNAENKRMIIKFIDNKKGL